MVNVLEAEAPTEIPNSQYSVLESPISIPKLNIPSFKYYAYEQVTETWSEHEWSAFNTIIQKESAWNNEAQNPNSTAFGYGQFLNSTWKLVGCTKTPDANIQIDCTIKYIQKVYGTPTKALQFHRLNNYY